MTVAIIKHLIKQLYDQALDLEVAGEWGRRWKLPSRPPSSRGSRCSNPFDGADEPNHWQQDRRGSIPSKWNPRRVHTGTNLLGNSPASRVPVRRKSPQAEEARELAAGLKKIPRLLHSDQYIPAALVAGSRSRIDAGRHPATLLSQATVLPEQIRLRCLRFPSPPFQELPRCWTDRGRSPRGIRHGVRRHYRVQQQELLCWRGCRHSRPHTVDRQRNRSRRAPVCERPTVDSRPQTDHPGSPRARRKARPDLLMSTSKPIQEKGQNREELSDLFLEDRLVMVGRVRGRQETIEIDQPSGWDSIDRGHDPFKKRSVLRAKRQMVSTDKRDELLKKNRFDFWSKALENPGWRQVRRIRILRDAGSSSVMKPDPNAPGPSCVVQVEELKTFISGSGFALLNAFWALWAE